MRRSADQTQACVRDSVPDASECVEEELHILARIVRAAEHFDAVRATGEVALASLPDAIRPIARALPAGALSDALHHALGGGHVNGSAYWFVLLAWAVA